MFTGKPALLLWPKLFEGMVWEGQYKSSGNGDVYGFSSGNGVGKGHFYGTHSGFGYGNGWAYDYGCPMGSGTGGMK